MAYNALSQHDVVSPDDSASDYSTSPRNSPPLESDHRPALFLAGSRYAGMQVDSPGTRATYDMVEDDDFESKPEHEHGNPVENELHVKRQRSHAASSDADNQNTKLATQTTPFTTAPATPEQGTPSMRSASLRSVSVPLRHPTPDVSMPGSMVGNVEHLERTAERLSMTSDMALEIQKMNLEQKRSDSRRSSLLTSPELLPVTKQFSSNSIVEMNNTARSGGYSPGGFMISPRSSFSNRRSASKGSRYSSRPEPEQEGRPLDSFVNSLPTLSPVNSRASSFAEGAEMSTMARALAGANVTSNPVESKKEQASTQPGVDESERPTTSASQTTIEQAQKMFQDFDGVHSHHFVSRSRATSTSDDGTNQGQNFSQGLKLPAAQPRPEVDNIQMQGSSGLHSSAYAARPQTYADPKTGQQMVYYPAPVPAILNLPQKLSNKPISMARDKRRSSQALGNVPDGARQSAAWLPDVLENDVESAASKNGDTENKSTSTASRRVTQDMSKIPPMSPQLRGIAHFNHPSIDKRIPGRASRIEMKGQSAVATLDSILDASVNAPVSAFVGQVGPEVYGKSKPDKTSQSKPAETVEEKDETKKRRGSFGQWLSRASGLDYDFNTIATDLSTVDIKKAREKEKEKESRRSMLTISDTGKLTPAGREENHSRGPSPSEPRIGIDNGDEDGQFDDEEYLGPPTTLLAELQLRKQQAKQRTRPTISMYPNGIHSTLLELDQVAEMEKKARERRQVRLGWEENGQAEDDDEDVPLGVLYPGQTVSQPRLRPLNLIARRELEDNEPLSRRRDRLQAGPAGPARRTSSTSMLDVPLPGEKSAKRESFLATSRPVSGDFASELMSQFGGDLMNDDSKDKGKGKAADGGAVPEEEETLAQRKKRLRAERQAREAEVGQGLGIRVAATNQEPSRPQLRQRRSMADILTANPAGGRASPGPQLVVKRSSSYELGGGLLALHDQESKRRSTALSIDHIKASPKPPQRPQNNRVSSMSMAGMAPNMGVGMMGSVPYGTTPGFHNPGTYPQFVSPTMGLGVQGAGFGQGLNQMSLMQQQQYMMAGYGTYPAYGYGPQMPYMGMMPMGYGAQMPMAPMNGMGMQQMQLNQNQLDMVERWRQSITQ